MSVQPEIIQIESRFGVNTRNIFYKQDAGAEKLLIMLPGRAYTCDFPALYYLRSAALHLGYDVLCVEYGFQAAYSEFGLHQAPDLAADVEDTVQPVLSRGYKQVCVAGKSLGTPLAVHVARSVTDIPVSLILLTPVGESTRGLAGIRTLVIIGTADRAYSPQEVAVFDGQPDMTWCVFAGADHGLEVAGNWSESLTIMHNVIDACATFLGAVS